MKIILFLFVYLLIAGISGYSQSRISLAVTDESVREVIREIQSKSEYTFFYNEDFIDLDEKVTYVSDNEPVIDILRDLAAKTGLKFNILQNNLVVVTKSAQTNNKLTGKVTNEKDEPVPGASVSVKGTLIAAITNADGKYSLVIPRDAKIIVFSYVGMLRKEIEIGNLSVLNVALRQATIGLEEIVVIGYGIRSKKDVTSSISTINQTSIKQSTAMTPELAMQGRMTGVFVVSGGGNPMARPTIRIRGVNTWGITTPLYIIDGVPVIEYGAGIEGLDDLRASDIRGPLNIMAMIDPNDIESISVLKDASAAAVYGVRAANGVIMITTKKGKGDKPALEFSTRFGVQNISQKTNVMNSQQYAGFLGKVLASDATIAMSPDNVGFFDPNDPKYLGNSPTYDWQEEIKRKNALVKDFSVRVLGGTAKTDYYVSFSSTNNEGAIKFNYLDRLSGSFKLNTQVNKWLRIGTNYRITSGKGRDSGASLVETGLFPPWQKMYDVNGLNGYAPTVVGRLASGSYSNEKLYGNGTRINVLGIAASEDVVFKSLRNIGSAYVEVEPLKDLKIKGQISMDIYGYSRNIFIDYDGSVFNYTTGDRSASTNGNSVGSYEERDVYNNNIIKEINVSYTKSLGKHNFDMVFNGSDQQYNAKYKLASTLWVQSKTNYRLGGDPKYTSNSSDFTNSALEGLMGRISYNFNSDYYLDVTLRRDGSTRFSEENRWGTFPSFSAAWRISNEAFMKNINYISDLKIRGGYGKLGNQEVRDLAYLSPIDNRPTFAWGNNGYLTGMGNRGIGAAVYSIPNPDLQWEKTSTANIGFDAKFFENKFSMSFDYFNKLTSGILQNVTLPLSAGVIQMPVDNIAKVRNTGIELSMNYNYSVGDLKYSIGANLSTVKNEVEETSGHIPVGSIEEGYSINYIKGYKTGGIFQSQTEVADWMAKHTDASYQNAKIAPGDYYFLDQRSTPTKPNTYYKDSLDNKIDSYDQVYLGKTIPGFYYGLNVSLEYKNIDFNAQFTGVGDVQKVNMVKMSLYYTSTTNMNESVEVLNAWTPENKSTTMPRAINGDPAQNYRLSDRFVESGAYCRLTYLQVGYTFSKKIYGYLHNIVSNCHIYAGTSNLFTITRYTGYDPENDTYPTPRTIFMGLDFRF